MPDDWRALGEALQALAQTSARRVRDVYRFQLEALLACTDAKLSIAAVEPDLEGAELSLRASSGSLGPELQDAYNDWQAVKDLHGEWRAIDEAREDGESPWEGFREAIAASGWLVDGNDLAACPALAAEAREHADPYDCWPLVATGERVADLIGEAIGQVRARAGLSIDELPDPDVSRLPDEPVLVPCDAAQELERMHALLADRLPRARLLGRIAPLLRTR